MDFSSTTELESFVNDVIAYVLFLKEKVAFSCFKEFRRNVDGGSDLVAILCRFPRHSLLRVVLEPVIVFSFLVRSHATISGAVS